jgi:hypothetical protein
MGQKMRKFAGISFLLASALCAACLVSPVLSRQAAAADARSITEGARVGCAMPGQGGKCAPAPAPTPVAEPDAASEAIIKILRPLLMAGGQPEPEFRVRDKNLITWSQPGSPNAGAFVNVPGGGDAAQMLAEKMADMEAKCGARTTYDTPASSSLEFVLSVHSGSLECAERRALIHVVAVERKQSLWVFILTAPADDGALALLTKQSLRATFAR